jgi:hypothetical protein
MAAERVTRRPRHPSALATDREVSVVAAVLEAKRRAPPDGGALLVVPFLLL